MRYIEANPVRAGIAKTADDWQWSSFAQRLNATRPFDLNHGPLPIPQGWPTIVNAALPEKDDAQLANCIKRGSPYGDQEWTIKTANELNLEATIRKKGRPRIYT